MKLLEIKDNLGYFVDEQGQFERIDKITKEDLLRLIDLTLENDTEFDECNDDNLQNQAHQIIYKNIYEKLKGLRVRKQEFKDESERLYLQEYERYRDEHGECADK